MTRGQPIVGPRGPDPGGGPARSCRRGGGLPRVSATGGLARAGGDGEAGGVPRRGVLGPPGPGLRRPGARVVIVGLAPGRARRQPHRADVHRRPLRRLPLRVAAPHRLRQPAHQHAPRRWSAAHRRVDHRAGAVRAAGQPADAGRARHVPPVPRARAGAPRCPGVRRRSAPSPTRACAASSGSAPRPKFAHGVEVPLDEAAGSSAASTSASRTPSPASSPSPCSTPSSAEELQVSADAEAAGRRSRSKRQSRAVISAAA